MSLKLPALLLACSGGILLSPTEEGAQDSASSADSDRPGDSAAPQSIPDAPDPSEEIFDVGQVRDVELTMAPEDWADIRDDPWAKNWHEAEFRWDDESVTGAAVRAFGHGSLTTGKPSLKISFDRLTPGQEWRGLDELKLDNSRQDVGFLSERIATAVLRDAGLPAARTGWAQVAVNGEAVGFFVVLESIDDRFVQRWFGHDDGHLYSTNEHYWGQGLNPIPEDPLTWYEPQTSAGGDAWDLVELSQVVATGSDEELLAALDLEQFAAISITRSVMGSLDAFSADGNNFYLYDDDGLWKLIPWDFDVDLGYPYYFETALAVDLRAPWTSSPWSYNCMSYEDYQDPVLQRALALGFDPDALVEELLQGPLEWGSISAAVAEAADLIGPYVEQDALGYGPYFACRQADLRLFLHTRLCALAGQEVALCPEPEDGVLRAADLSPSGSVGWGSLLTDSTNWGPGFVVNGLHHCTGLFAHAPSSVSLQVPEGYGRLRGLVGLQDWNRSTVCDDGATFHVLQEGVELWSSGSVNGYQDAVAFEDIAVEPGALTLEVRENGGYSCDTSCWLDLELTPIAAH